MCMLSIGSVGCALLLAWDDIWSGRVRFAALVLVTNCEDERGPWMSSSRSLERCRRVEPTENA
eukprot:2125719-Amphidinium_carterae.1